LVAGLLVAGSLARRAEATLEFSEPGFSLETVVDLDDFLPVGVAFGPGNRIFVWERQGVVRLIKDDVLLPTPFLDISAKVNYRNDSGLLGLALDPDWETNGYVYLAYVYEHNNPPQPLGDGPRTARIVRVTADPSNKDVMLAGSEVVLIGSLGVPPCSQYPAGSDCIPTDIGIHTIGTLRFAPDGSLFVGNGDGSSATDPAAAALRSQDLDSYSGKILRIHADGTAVDDNPFYDGTDSVHSRVWAYGLRNPFRFTLDPEVGEPVIGDVGSGNWEELDAGLGANFGWPCFEGFARHVLFNAAYPECALLPDDAVTAPLYAVSHPESSAIAAGTFYTGTVYPEILRGELFFFDYVSGWIRRAHFENGVLSNVQPFAEDPAGETHPVALEQGPDGLLYYVDLLSGELVRIRYLGPSAVATATPLAGYSPLHVDFSSAGSASSGGPLALDWDFGDRFVSHDTDPSHTYVSSTVRTITARLTVHDDNGSAHSAPIPIVVGSLPPTATIEAPGDGATVDLFSYVTFSGSATDPDDGPLPPSALHWTVLHRHDSHEHGFLLLDGSSGSFRVPDFGEGAHGFEIYLRAVDSSGLASTAHVSLDIVPALFADDFETGELVRWSDVLPGS